MSASLAKSGSGVLGWFGVAGLLSLAVWVVPSCDTVDKVADNLPTLPTPEPTPRPVPVTFRDEPDIRVRVSKGAPKKMFSGPAKLVVRPVGTTGKSLILRTPLTVTSGAGGVVVVDGGKAKHTWPAGVDVEVMPSEENPLAAAGPTQSIMLDGARLPGFVTVRPSWGDAPARFDVIATMPIETYLPGVVTNELLKDWPRQTNEVQSVCARTYALHERDRARREGRAVDVENTTSDQVYASNASQVATEAVRATRGMVLVSEGKLLRAYFSSQCGGRAASAADVWPNTGVYVFNKAKPLQGQPRQVYCQRSPLYRWEVTRRDDDVNKRLRAWGKATDNDVATIGRLRSVEVAERNDAQRPNKYRLDDVSGHTYILRAEELRMALNQPVAGLPPITKENRINSGDLDVTVWASEVRFTGRGWGHGVGMCQWCAKGMAEAGMDWTSMVHQFYPGAEVVKAY